ncbi:MAG: hypothetical protein IKA44_03070 [Clostridia bacterium]|nr:hypothetical protein [Clostridia bacterium]
MKKTNRIFYIFSVLIVIAFLLVYLIWGIIDLNRAWGGFVFVVFPIILVPLLIAFEELLFLVKFLIDQKKNRTILPFKIAETFLALYLILTFFVIVMDLEDVIFVCQSWLLIPAACLIVMLWLAEGLVWYFQRRKEKKKEVAESEEAAV